MKPDLPAPFPAAPHREPLLHVFKLVVLLQVLVYLEAGAVPCLLARISFEFGLTSFQQGCLGGGVYAALSVACPAAGWLIQRFPPRAVMGTSLVVHCCTCILFAMVSTNAPWLLIVARVAIGFTQAFLMVYCPLWVEENAPPASRTLWMSGLQASVPVGIMLGYVLGMIALQVGDGPLLAWRYPFLAQAALVLPFATRVFFMPGIDSRAEGSAAGGGRESPTSVDSSSSSSSAASTASSSSSSASFDRVLTAFAPVDPRPEGPALPWVADVATGDRTDSDDGSETSFAGLHIRASTLRDYARPALLPTSFFFEASQLPATAHATRTRRRRPTTPEMSRNRSISDAIRHSAAHRRADTGEDAASPPHPHPGTSTVKALSARGRSATMEVDFSRRPTLGQPGVGPTSPGPPSPQPESPARGDDAGLYRVPELDSDEEPAAEVTPPQLDARERASPPAPVPALAAARVKAWRRLLGVPEYSFLVIALSALYFVVTGVQFWATAFMIRTLPGESHLVIMTLFVITSATAPVLGVFFGGWVIDRLGGYAAGPAQRARALRAISAMGTGAAAAGLATTVWLNLVWIVACIWLLLFLGGAVVPPCTGIFLNASPHDLRAYASSLSVTLFNILGYALSPLVSGWVRGHTHSELAGFRTVLFAGVVGVFFIYLAAYHSARRAARLSGGILLQGGPSDTLLAGRRGRDYQAVAHA